MTTDPAALELARAWVLEQFQLAAQAPTMEEQLPIFTRIAEAVLGDSRDVLLEYAAASREVIEARKAGLAVEKRRAEQECKDGLARVDAAVEVLAPPNRAARRARK